MKEKSKIVIEINPNGVVKSETFGIEGPTCIDELNKLLAELGSEENQTLKPDYFKSKIINNNQVKQKVNK